MPSAIEVNLFQGVFNFIYKFEFFEKFKFQENDFFRFFWISKELLTTLKAFKSRISSSQEKKIKNTEVKSKKSQGGEGGEKE